MNTPRGRLADILLLLLISALSAEIIFNNLGASTIWSWDEARGAENALEILKTGDWIVLDYGGKPDLRNLKGPLPAWLIAISFKIFGMNEFALRLWSALFGVATVAVVYLFGLEIKNRYVGLYAALILLSTRGFIGYHGARTGDCDVMVTFFLALALYLFYLGQKKNHLLFPIFAAASMGLGLLVKGLIMIVPVIIALYLLYFKSFKKAVFSKGAMYSVITFFCTAGPWLIARFIRGRDFFIKKIQFDIIKRFSVAIEGHTGDWSYYFTVFRKEGPGVVLLYLLLIFFIYSCYLFIKKDRPASLLLMWLIPYFLIISFIKTKTFWYLMPLYPAMSLLIAYNLETARELFKARKMLIIPLCLMVIAFPLISTANYTCNVAIEPKVEAIKNMKKELNSVNNIYIRKNENTQAIFFYLNVSARGKVIVYDRIEEINPLKGDAIVTFDSRLADIISGRVDYRFITRTGNACLFVKM